MSRLIVEGLSWHTTDETLRECFEIFGTVEEAVVVRDRETKKSHGFVRFTNRKEADEAVSDLNNVELDGSTIQVNLVERSAKRHPRSIQRDRDSYMRPGVSDRESGTGPLQTVEGNKFTALFRAIRNTDASVLRSLIAAKADVNTTDSSGTAAIHFAVKLCNETAVRLLLEAGADVNIPDSSGSVAIHFAADRGFTSILGLLLEAGADVNIPDSSGSVAIHFAADRGFTTETRLLLDAGADVNVPDSSGSVAIHFAADRGFTTETRLLLDAGADVNASDSSGSVAIHFAAQRGLTTETRLLLYAGADVNVPDSSGSVAIHFAMRRGLTTETRLLLDAGADVNASDSSGSVAIHFAVQRGLSIETRLLLEAGADVTAEKNNGMTAVHIAEQKNDIGILTLLKGWGDTAASEFISSTNFKDLRPLLSTASRSYKNPETLKSDLLSLLVQYCHDLLEVAKSGSQRVVVGGIRNQASNIIDQILVQSYLVDYLLKSVQVFNTEQRADVGDANRIDSEVSVDVDRALKPQNRKESEDNHISTTNASKILFAEVKDFLMSGRPFGEFRLALRKIIRQKPMDAIHEEVYYSARGVEEDSFRATFHVHWELPDYLSREMTTTQTLGPVLTISGDPQNAFATACNKYMQWLWSDQYSWQYLLDAIVTTVTGDRSTRYHLTAFDMFSQQSENDASSYHTVVSVFGTKQVITTLAQQLAWLSAVFRVPKSDQLTLSHVDFMWIGESEFELRPTELEEIGTKQSVCWHPLLRGSSIASGFPIPERGDEIGLELPFQAMVELAGVSFTTTCSGRTALCGFSTLLYPTAQSPSTAVDGVPSCVQWHLVANEDPHSELNSAEVLAENQNQWLGTEDEGSLVQARTFVGYCRASCIYLGTETSAYTELKASNLADDGAAPGVKIKSLTAGTSGLGIFGVQAGLDIVYPQSLTVLSNIETFDDILESTRNMAILLYDAGERRGWLVLAQSVLLHMAQIWIRRNVPTVKLPFAKPDWDGANAIENIMRDSHKLELRKLLDNDQSYYFRDLIKRFWSDLKGCAIARKQRKDEDQGAQKVPRSKLRGWELMDFINRPLEFCMKEEDVNFSGCGWESLAEDKDIFVLVCRGLGEIIRPAPSMQLCQEWASVPCGKKHLAASINCLQQMSDKHDNGEVCMRLTNRVFWWPPAHLLQHFLNDCTHDAEAPCKKTNQKARRLADASVGSPLQLPPEGAVIFGKTFFKLHKRGARSGR